MWISKEEDGLWEERGERERGVFVGGEREKRADTEGYCCISSVSSCLASENRQRPAVSGLFPFNVFLSTPSLSHPHLAFLTLPLRSSFSSVFTAHPSFFLIHLLCCCFFLSSSSDVQQLGSKLENEASVFMNGVYVRFTLRYRFLSQMGP